MAKRCSDILEMIHDYIDGLLDEADQVDFEQHLEQCDSCADEYHFMKQMVASLSEIEVIEMPESLHEDIMTSIEAVKTEQKAPRFIRIMRPVTSVVAAAFLLFVVFSVLTTFNVLDERLDMNKQAPAEMADDVSTHSLLETAGRGDLDDNDMNVNDMAGALVSEEAFVEDMESEMTIASDDEMYPNNFDDSEAMLSYEAYEMEDADMAADGDWIDSAEMREPESDAYGDMATANGIISDIPTDDSLNVRKDYDELEVETDALELTWATIFTERDESSEENAADHNDEKITTASESGRVLDNLPIIIPTGVLLTVAGVILFIYRKHK